MPEKNNNEFLKLTVPNAEQNKFRQEIKKIKNGKYEVEQLNDGKKVVISKPGSKGPNDFRVDLYDPNSGIRKSLKHSEIFDDIERKDKNDRENIRNLIKGLFAVCKGKEPDQVIRKRKIENSVGMPVDTILKIYKWIWGQEDCNYEHGQGRWMSMNSLLDKYTIDKYTINDEEV